MVDISRNEAKLAGIAAVEHPLRRRLYRLLLAGRGWITRDEAAEAMDVGRPVVAFHLDKLVEAGLLEVSYERTSGRSGPGAGRPAKRYRATGEEVTAAVPDRHYDLAGSLLAAAVADSDRTGEPVRSCLTAVASAAGRRRGDEAVDGSGPPTDAQARRHAVVDALADDGYEPEWDDHCEISLGNCPFHRLAEQQRELVCGMNLDFLTGMLMALDPSDTLSAQLRPEPDHCCVRICDGSTGS